MYKINNAVVFAPQHHSKKAYLIGIIAILTKISQYWRYRRLTQAINRGELTTAIEILESSGLRDKVAQLFIICNICTLQSEDAR